MGRKAATRTGICLLWCVQLQAATYFVGGSRGTAAITNDGRDNVGLNLSGASFSSATRVLTKTGAFAGYTPANLDYIRLLAGSESGVYPILSKINGDQLQLGDIFADEGLTGDHVGTISSATGPKPFLSSLRTLVTNGDTVYCYPGVYNESTFLILDAAYAGKAVTYCGFTSEHRVTLRSADANYVVRVHYTMTSGDITFRHIDIEGDKVHGPVSIAHGNPTLRFIDCNLTNHRSSSGLGIYEWDITSPGAGRIIMSGGSVTAYNSCFYIKNSDGCLLEGTSLKTRNPSQPILQFSNGTKRIELEGCALTGTANNLILLSHNLNSYVDLVRIERCMGTIGRAWREEDYIKYLVMRNNALTLSYSGAGIRCGLEVDGPPTQTINPYPYSGGLIVGNDLQFSSTNVTHEVFLGIGANNFIVTDNQFRRTGGSVANFGFVCKSDNNLIANNRMYGSKQVLYIAGSQGNVIKNNSIYAFSGIAFRIDSHQDAAVDPNLGQAKCNRVYNNIFVSADAEALTCDNGADDDAYLWGNWLDYNILWRENAGNLVRLGSITTTRNEAVADQRALNAAWATYLGTDYGISQVNDENSLAADPQIASPASGDWSFPATSSALNAALGGGNLGAWQSVAQPSDSDSDGIPDQWDNCPTASNPGQDDMDHDGIGDVCDACPRDANNDADGDRVCGDIDTCPTAANVDQSDGDEDGVGDVCDNCPDTPAGRQVDSSGCPLPIAPDLDGDGDVDQEDFGIFQRCASGPGVAADPGCLD